MKTFLGKILLPTILAFSLFACFCPIDIPDRVTLQEAVGIYQRLGQDSSFELIELKEDTTYLHTILGMHDTLTNTGKYTVCTSTVSSVELAGFDTFGDSLFVFAYDSLCYMVLKTGELNLKYDWDFGEKEFYKIENPAIDSAFKSDTVSETDDFCGLYLSFNRELKYINYVVVKPDGTYVHYYVSDTDTLSHSGNYRIFETKGRFWFLKINYIELTNWYSYGNENQYYLRTFGGTRLALIDDYEMRIEFWFFNDFDYHKYPDKHSFVHHIWNKEMPERFKQYIIDNVFGGQDE